METNQLQNTGKINTTYAISFNPSFDWGHDIDCEKTKYQFGTPTMLFLDNKFMMELQGFLPQIMDYLKDTDVIIPLNDFNDIETSDDLETIFNIIIDNEIFLGVDISIMTYTQYQQMIYDNQ